MDAVVCFVESFSVYRKVVGETVVFVEVAVLVGLVEAARTVDTVGYIFAVGLIVSSCRFWRDKMKVCSYFLRPSTNEHFNKPVSKWLGNSIT